MQDKICSYQIKVQGIVQGVGFRPYVFRLARECELQGWVLNSSAGVFIEVEGNGGKLKEFARRLVDDPPPLAVIRSCEIKEIDPQGFHEFTIRESEDLEEKVVMVSPDIAICKECQ
jgi:hydrogenase maturation protein HypF